MLTRFREVSERMMGRILPKAEVRADICGGQCLSDPRRRMRYLWSAMGYPIQAGCDCPF